jgi:hypothetical protein
VIAPGAIVRSFRLDRVYVVRAVSGPNGERVHFCGQRGSTWWHVDNVEVLLPFAPAVIDAATVSVVLARAGVRYVGALCLRMLVRWAMDRGLAWMVEQVLRDPGLTIMVTADDAYGALSFAHAWLPRALQVRPHQ